MIIGSVLAAISRALMIMTYTAEYCRQLMTNIRRCFNPNTIKLGSTTGLKHALNCTEGRGQPCASLSISSLLGTHYTYIKNGHPTRLNMVDLYIQTIQSFLQAVRRVASRGHKEVVSSVPAFIATSVFYLPSKCCSSSVTIATIQSQGLDTCRPELRRNDRETITNARKQIHEPLNKRNHRIFPRPTLVTERNTPGGTSRSFQVPHQSLRYACGKKVYSCAYTNRERAKYRMQGSYPCLSICTL